ncbi:MAG TPA: heavy-metal-associated domain-containing protein, partial [Phycisphaerae bacterium]|nr:heavy-metal-associated domain-containing protein [Phycisphaerae bacterium]
MSKSVSANVKSISDPTQQTADFPVQGMTCSACAVRLEKALTRAEGIETAGVNFALERANVSFDTNTTDINAIAGVI